MRFLSLLLLIASFNNLHAQESPKYDIISVDESMIDLYYKFDSNEKYNDFINKHNLLEGLSKPSNFEHLQNILSSLPNYQLLPGGSATNTAIAANKAGTKTGIIALVGDNEFSKLYIESVSTINNHLQHKKNFSPPMLGLIISPEGERTMITFAGNAREFHKEDFPLDEIKNYKILQVSGYLLDVNTNTQKVYQWLFKECNKLGVKVAIVLPSNNEIVKRIAPLIHNNLSNISYIIGNNFEFEALFSINSISDIPLLQKLPPSFVITLGGQGSFGVSSESIVYQKAFKPHAVVDTTGAGDTFAGGFLSAVSQGSDLSHSLCWGAATAQVVVEQEGARLQGSVYEHNKKLCG